jgi:hypothetical protein
MQHKFMQHKQVLPKSKKGMWFRGWIQEALNLAWVGLKYLELMLPAQML